jgi:N-acetylglutamate synthase-like GNAT family acetyltransferase
LRPAVETESAAIKDLIHLVGINPTGLDWKRFLVAVTPEGRVIGCGQLKPHGGDILELASIATSPEYRNQGIASAIIEVLLAQSPRPLYLMCESKMGPFYEKIGFQSLPPAEMPRYFQRIVKLVGLADLISRSGHGLFVMKLK